ncbi:hypothetical protein Bca4012_043885 [Brassica carinata]|uniref:Uncharacterized protein n=3 Tax=Brassica TaxID=3705 RepID=A0A0D3E8Z9_BRAOL|nr:unnamed protein product [Brassica napus]VDD31139.1 unnamed protein product [Brassica oleracea]
MGEDKSNLYIWVIRHDSPSMVEKASGASIVNICSIKPNLLTEVEGRRRTENRHI